MLESLTYLGLDGLAFAAERGLLEQKAGDLDFVAGELGPLFEFRMLAKSGLLPKPESAPWLTLNGYGALYKAYNQKPQWICPRTRRTGVYRTRARRPVEEPSWVWFCQGMQHAAEEEGFPKPIAYQLVGAITELQSNIYEHSGVPETGFVAFKASPGKFEFVVADAGMGVLRSLRGCSEYSKLSDHGEALKLVLTDGVSRHGHGTGRGMGFRPLFVGLANLNGTLRFRSGDHAVIMNDQKTQVAQKPRIEGFFVSVCCCMN